MTEKTGTLNSTTEGRADTIEVCGTGPEQVFVATVPPNEKLLIKAINGFDTVVDLRVGGSCPGLTQEVCVDDHDHTPFLYTNEGDSPQTVYFIVSGYYYTSGNFTVEWDISTTAVCPDDYDGPVLYSTCTRSCANGLFNLFFNANGCYPNAMCQYDDEFMTNGEYGGGLTPGAPFLCASGPPDTSEPPDSSSTGAIIGGVVAAVLLAAVAGYFVYARLQKNKMLAGNFGFERNLL